MKLRGGSQVFVWALVVLSILVGGLVLPAPGNATDFPLRAKHPTASPIETEALAAIYGTAVIVDSRNEAEYEVIHITGAHNILVGKMEEQDLVKIRDKQSTTPLVFYCNGITCSKSYKAAEKAQELGFSNVRVYDAGIFAWAKAYPEKSEFFGSPLTAETLDTSLISDARFEAALLPAAEFLDRAKSGNHTLFDIRDPNERSETPFTFPGMKTMSFDTFIRLLKQGSRAVPKKDILILDNVGKQVRWLQYYLDREGVKNYRFLKGGVRALEKEGLLK